MLMLNARHLWKLVVVMAGLGVILGTDAPTVRTESQSPASPAYDPGLFSPLKWRSIGPNRGGRSIAAAGSPGRRLEYYFGATGGGLWKTTDGGISWTPVTDGQIASSSVGAVAVSESNPDVVYLGMGEVQLRGNIMQGDGVYKSVDGGKTWTHLGLADTHAIGRIRIHPTNPDIVYVAALGHPFGRNDERGVFRSRDGGKTWTKVLFRSDRAGAVDLSLDHNHPEVLYASLWEVYRTPWLLWSGGDGSGLFKSADGGETWTELTRNPGLPKGILGKITVSVSRADSRRVYALVEAADGGLFRSDDAGATWTKVNESRDLRQRAFYFSRILADPRNADTLYVLNYQFLKSVDGGKSFAIIEAPHGDHHDLWIDPSDPQRMINSNDGGANVSVNGGTTWTAQDYPTAQMYHVATTLSFPYHVCGAQQDNSTACVPSNERGDTYYAVGGGESGYVAPDPRNPSIFYAGSYDGLVTRYNRATGQSREVDAYPWFTTGQSAASSPERWQWTFPIVVSPHDPNILYVSSQHLWRTTNAGQSWERISPDLTRADPKTLGDSGGPITKDQSGPEVYGTIFTIAPSRREPRTIWAGSDDGLVHLTRDDGKTWQKVTPGDMPEFTRVSLIEASPHDAATAYVAGKRYQLDDRAPYIWKTNDYGKSWLKIVNGIRKDDYVHAVREDPARRGLLYAGTEHGIYVSFDDGARWQSLSLNLPDVQVPDIAVEGHDLVIATHGRSFYVLDDIEPIRQLTQQVLDAPAHLFKPRGAVRRTVPGTIDYYLKTPGSKVAVEILDSGGQVIRTLSGPNKPGLGRVTWDLRYPGATVFKGMIMRSARPERGPLAVPGRFQVRLVVDGQNQTADLMVEKDPRLTDVTQADLDEQFQLAMKIRDRVSAANEGVILIRAIKDQVTDRLGKTKDRRIVTAAEGLRAKLSAVEDELHQVKNESPKDPLNFGVKINNRLAALGETVESADARPTNQTYTVFTRLSADLDALLQQLDTLLGQDLVQLNKLLAGQRLAPIEAARRRALTEP